jgi:hypothetical protein
MTKILTVTLSGPGADTALTALDEQGNLTITLRDTESAAAAPAPPAPLRIGFHPTPAEYGTWLPKLPTPWFTRVFNPPGKGLPAWGGTAVTGLPAGTIRHISFKDRVSPAAITEFLDSIPASVPAVWLTWHHEGDIDWASDVAGYTNYWKLLRAVVDGHQAGPKVTLVNVHTQYASRYKRQAMDWRQFMLPDVADVDSWDCYRPVSPNVYEAPETLLGLALAARQEFGVRLHITEYGTHPTSWDSDGTGQATWYRESCEVMAAASVEAVGFWCNADGPLEYRPTKPAVLNEWKNLMTKYNSAA